MKIDILCVGKIKESYLTNAIAEYQKRLGTYAKLTITEVKDERTSEHSNDKETEMVLKAEAERLDKYIHKDAYVIALCVEGKQKTSEEFSDTFQHLALEGNSHVQFLIGGSLGLHDSLKKRADLQLGFSKMTFPHQLMRVILLEQIYRAFRIWNKEPYHK